METKTTEGAEGQTIAANVNRTSPLRRRRNGDAPNLRYFLLKPGSSAVKPELGQETASEGEALIEAFRAGQPFYTLAMWKAIPELNGSNPVIVKQAVAQKTTQS
jgi:hypothetical protein